MGSSKSKPVVVVDDDEAINVVKGTDIEMIQELSKIDITQINALNALINKFENQRM